MSMFVHVRWVGGSSNVHVDIYLFFKPNLKSNFLVGSSPLVLHKLKLIFASTPSFLPVEVGTLVSLLREHACKEKISQFSSLLALIYYIKTSRENVAIKCLLA